ncbi:MAG: hypothetical protein MUC87_21690 [Bacteroidia bacterium]|jgi:hypothetical protein|nr:hypothetical protein [Bacteroidia bacterium]
MRALINIRILILLAAIWPGAAGVYAQSTVHINAAQLYLQQGNPDSAFVQIKKHFAQPGTSTDAVGYYIKGQIYKELYKKYSPTEPLTWYLDSAFVAQTQAQKYATDSSQQVNIRRAMLFIASKYYNSAAERLDTVNYEKAKQCYEKYRIISLQADPKVNLTQRDVEFWLALATVYEDLYNKNKENGEKYFIMTEQLLNKVLELDPNSYAARYRFSVLYWNKGVDVILSVPIDASIPEAEQKQDDALIWFRKALPHAELAFQLNPNRVETLIVLSGIYYSMNDFDKSKTFDEMRQELERKQGGGK